MLLKGLKRVLDASTKKKFPITQDILPSLFTLVDLPSPVDVAFWASCLVAFFSFFQKSILLIKNMESFNLKPHLCHRVATFSKDGVILAVHWSKMILYRQRTLHRHSVYPCGFAAFLRACIRLFTTQHITFDFH